MEKNGIVALYHKAPQGMSEERKLHLKPNKRISPIHPLAEESASSFAE